MFNDTVLVLPTAGTTGSPKLVPLTQANINASVNAWIKALGLTSNDRCLNVLPIWHGSFIANTLTSTLIKAAVINTQASSVDELWELIERYNPTWLPLPYDLSQQILNDERIYHPKNNLRFVRTSKSTLARHHIELLQYVFKCPVLGSYGMTEAASGPIACETLKQRKPGSVGKPVHLDVKIDKDGQILIKGSSVMQGGYVNGPPDVFVYSWIDGERWLNTRDKGHFDKDGFLYLDGRM